MSVIMEQHTRWLEARKRLQGGNNKPRSEKAVVLRTLAPGAQQTVRVAKDVPLPTGRDRYHQKGKADDAALEREGHRLINAICHKHFVTKREIVSQIRRSDVVDARNEAYYRLRRELALPFAMIGRLLGNRDHTTVLSGARRYALLNGRAEP